MGPLRERLRPVLVLAWALVAGCQVSRPPAPESTRQLRVVDVRRVVDRPARSPAVWSPDGAALAFTADGRVWVYRLEGTLRSVAAVREGRRLSWSGPVGLLAVVDEGTVWTLRPDGTSRRLLPLGGRAVHAAWAPGSDRLAVVVRRPQPGGVADELWLTNRDGGFRRLVYAAPSGRRIADVQWFSDSLYLLVGLSADGRAITETWRVRIAYPDRRSLPVEGPADALALSPSGRQLAVVVRDRSEVRRLVVQRLDGTGRLTLATGRLSGVSWSPQSDKVAFALIGPDGWAEVVAVDADGSGRLPVHAYGLEFPGPAAAVAAAWSPSGRALAFGTDTGDTVGPVWVARLARR
jgi:Tol biopolymer transport system component